ncbi:MAG: phage baseplate assembly protein V [Acetobacteraceae bacterium]|nr:phage baseplate assembly protein V [Acetobacteraceae bacterium]
MDRLLNAFKGHSSAQDALIGQPRFGTVTSVDPKSYTVRVQLQPEGVLTGWLPVLTTWVGKSWGVSCPPSPGDQVLILPQEGDAENGIVVGRAWSQDASVPETPVGEFWLTHKSGSHLRLLNDGTVSICGDLHVEGDIYDRHGSLDTLRTHYNQHSHNDPQGGTTSTPSPQD